MNGSHHRSLLTNREREIFALLLAEKTTRDIAEQLGISEKQCEITFPIQFKS